MQGQIIKKINIQQSSDSVVIVWCRCFNTVMWNTAM